MVSIWLKLVFEGFFVKSIASFDDTLTRIPVISHLTRERRGRIAFSVGTILALTVILIVAVFFSTFLNLIPHTRLVSTTLILILAIFVYFDLFLTKPARQLDFRLATIDFSTKHLAKMIGIGFVVSFITLIDDVIVLTPLFLGSGLSKFLSIIGVYLATILQIVAVVYFGGRLEKIKYKKEMASASLAVLAALVFAGVI